jgi:hypothetical protein
MPVETGDGEGESASFPGLEGNGCLDWEDDCGFLRQAWNGYCGDSRQSCHGEGEIN